MRDTPRLAVFNTAGSLKDPWYISFYNDLHRGIAEGARRLGFNFELFDKSKSLKEFVTQCQHARYVGALGVVAEHHPERKYWEELSHQIPSVHLMIPPLDPHAHYVGNDEKKTLLLLGEHLMNEGHRHMGFVAPFGYAHDRERYAAFKAMAGHFGLPVDARHVYGFDPNTGKPTFRGPWNGEGLPRRHQDLLRKMNQSILKEKSLPDVFIFSTDSLAYLFWEQATAQGPHPPLSIPGDLALAGIGDRSHLLEPRERRSLTTVQQNYEEMGAMAVRLLGDIAKGIKSPRNGSHILIPPVLRPRESSRRQPAATYKKHAFFSQVEAAVQKHLANDRALREIPSLMGISSSHFSKQFQLQKGLSFRKYITETRLERAVYLLEHTGEPIHQILKEIGFQHHRRFYEKFKARFGKPPTSFR